MMRHFVYISQSHMVIYTYMNMHAYMCTCIHTHTHRTQHTTHNQRTLNSADTSDSTKTSVEIPLYKHLLKYVHSCSCPRPHGSSEDNLWEFAPPCGAWVLNSSQEPSPDEDLAVLRNIPKCSFFWPSHWLRH